jgi:hypothetical protein
MVFFVGGVVICGPTACIETPRASSTSTLLCKGRERVFENMVILTYDDAVRSEGKFLVIPIIE